MKFIFRIDKESTKVVTYCFSCLLKAKLAGYHAKDISATSSSTLWLQDALPYSKSSVPHTKMVTYVSSECGDIELQRTVC